MSLIPYTQCSTENPVVSARNMHKKSTRQVIEEYRLGLNSSYNIKAKITYRILEQLREEVIKPEPLNLTSEMNCDTLYLDLEHCEERYILAGQKKKTSLTAVDLQSKSYQPLAEVKEWSRDHLSALKWFPSDYRLFSTATRKKLRIWDANKLSQIDMICLRGDILTYNHSHHTSSLIAATVHKRQPVMVDLRTGHVSSFLNDRGGSRTANLDITWSPTCEFILASSTDSGNLFVWDTRSLSCPLVQIQTGKSEPLISFYPDGIRLATISRKHLSVYNVWTNCASRIFEMETLEWAPISPCPAACPLSFHFGFMFVCLNRKFWIFGNAPSQTYLYHVFKPQRCYAFRPSTFELYSGNVNGLQKYSLFLSGLQTCPSDSLEINSDEFTYD